uniref:Partial AB-hydrolase lipase domain-containing protein n=1 Tax=Tetranychus urticae TaxID=32264 RepID=T1JV93_TETUR
MNALIFIVFYISILHESSGLTVDEAVSVSVDSSNPTLDKEQAFIQFIGSREPDEAATCDQLIESRGFQYEIYYVTTEDGYILQNFRIINPYAREARKKLKPILLLHPLFTTCSAWLFNSPGGHIKPWVNGHPPKDTSAALGFLLANLGFDVWMINVRGNSYSTNHTHLNPKDPEFWNYTVEEIAIYDVTATVEQIKKETGFVFKIFEAYFVIGLIVTDKTIIVVGHSQGTTQMLIQLSLMPEFEKNYDLVILAAPIGFLGDRTGFAGILPTELLIKVLSLRNAPFPPLSAITYGSLAEFCEQPAFIGVCELVFEGILGFDSPQLNRSRADVYLSLLDRSSNKNLIQLLQAIQRDHFSQFDYGEEINYEVYGSAEPPVYPFENINASKLVLISSLNDKLSTPINDLNLKNSFSSKPRGDYIIANPYFNHGDFLIAIEAYPYFSKLVSEIIQNEVSNLPGN